MRIGTAPSRRLMCCVNFCWPGGWKRVAFFGLGRVREGLYDVPMRAFRTSRTSANPHKIAVNAIEIGIKTSATASSYVFLQQELARGLRLSQPSRVAKDAARGELLGCLHDIARQQPHALVDAVDAAPARRSSRDATRDCCSTVCTRESAVAAKRAIRDDALTDIV